MFTKYILENKELSTASVELRNLKFIKTFTVEEFKASFGCNKIDVQKHPRGFLYFSFSKIMGFVVVHGIPNNPRISLVVDEFGIPYYILHEDGDIRDHYIINLDADVSVEEASEICRHNVSQDYVREKIDEEKILVSRSKYEIKEDDRFLIPFIQKTKIGFMNKEAEIVIPALYQLVLDDFHNEQSLVRVGEPYTVAFERKSSAPRVYAYERYGLLKANGELLFPMEYEDIAMPIYSNRIVLHSYNKGYAVIDFRGNFIVPFGKYNYIDGYDTGFARIKLGRSSNGCQESNNQWGIIDENGNEVLKPIYKNIWNFYNKSLSYTRVESDDQIFEFHFFTRQLMPNGYQKVKERDIQRGLDNYRESTYNEYNGSYAQDVMGYSDQDIDDAFDGDPEAYWNID